MTTPELPPLPPLGRFSQDFHRMRVMQDGAWCPYDDVKAIDDAREARERILLARIAELEAVCAGHYANTVEALRQANEAETAKPPREATERMVTQGMLAQISNFDQSARHQVAEIWRVMYIASESKG